MKYSMSHSPRLVPLSRSPGVFQPARKPASLLVLALFSTGIHAQALPADAGAVVQTGAVVDGSPLPPITVTVRRAAAEPDSARTSAASVTRIDAQDLATGSLDNVEQVLQSTPGVGVYTSGGPQDNTIYIRGVGSLYQSSSDEMLSGVSIDGLQVPARYLSLGTLDAEGVDIYKGPQGTRSAASAAAGMIDIRTVRPTAAAGGYLRAEVGRNGRNLEEFAWGGALGERLRGRIALRHIGEDSWVTNSQTGKPLSQPDDLSFRASLAGEIAPRTAFELTASQQRARENPNLLMLRPYADPPALSLPDDIYGINQQKLGLYSLRLTHDLDASRLSATTGYTRQRSTRVLAYDENLYQALYGMPMVYAQVYQGDDNNLSQDLQWSSLPGAAWDWNLGAYLSRGDRVNHTLAYPLQPGIGTARDYESRRHALFGDMSLPLTQKLKFGAGLRREWSRRSYEGRYNGGAAAVDQRQMDDAYTTGRLALSYAVARDAEVYTSLSSGYSPAGFQDYAGQSADSAPYRGARVNAFELGFKSVSADQRFALHGAFFHNGVRNNQILAYDSNTFVSQVFNMDSKSRGLEVDGTWRVSPQLSLSAMLAYTRAEIASDLTTTSGQIARGNRMPMVPEWSGQLQARYRTPLPSFAGMSAPVLNAQASYFHSGRRPADPHNHFDLGSYGKLDLRVGIQHGRAEFYLWADNLLDKRSDLYGYWASADVTYGAPARGRMVGIGLRYTL